MTHMTSKYDINIILKCKNQKGWWTKVLFINFEKPLYFFKVTIAKGNVIFEEKKCFAKCSENKTFDV